MLIVVPARAGSKRLPGKNMHPFGGFALIEWSLWAALYLKARLPDAVVQVTTDCPQITALVTKNYADKITLRHRPQALAGDTVQSADVLLDAANFAGMGTQGRYLLLQPTSPLRLLLDLDTFATLAHQEGAHVSCTPPVENPKDLINLVSALPALDASSGIHRDDSEAVHFVDGSFYAGDLAQLADTHSFMPKEKTQFHRLAMPRAADINTALDLHMALALKDWLSLQKMPFVRPAP